MLEDRWKAEVTYKVDDYGTLKRELFFFQELEDLHDIVEQGPNFCAIDKIEIWYNIPECRTTLCDVEIE